MRADIIVIGAGAAGLMTAITAANIARENGQAAPKVWVLDHANKAGKKILMSGGGRCNFTNLYCGPENFLSANRHFCKSALARYQPADFIALVDKHNVPWHEKTLGQLFCDRSSKDILGLLLNEADGAGVRIQLQTPISKISRLQQGFSLKTNQGDFFCDSLVIATGGLSIPKMGATGFGYDVARQFGLAIEETRAGLVPLTLAAPLLDAIAALKGISINPIRVNAGKKQFEEAMLCTHRGLSGPAILQISSYWREGYAVVIDLLPGLDVPAWLEAAAVERPQVELKTLLSQKFPKRFADFYCREFGNPRINQLTDKARQRWSEQLHHWKIQPAGTEGYRTAEVTLGGVSTAELSSSTMEAKQVPGLYFVGEVVDVTGHLGGHNFQWAWASGHAAGEATGRGLLASAQ